MAMTAVNLDNETLAMLDASAKARAISRDALLREAVQGIYDDDARLASIVAKSRAQIASGNFYTQEQVEQDGTELIREIDNLA